MNLKVNQRALLSALACGATLLAMSSQVNAQRVKVEERVRFTLSHTDKRFDNGITLRASVNVSDHHQDKYFPDHRSSFGHYSTRRDAGVDVVVSPWGFHVGVAPQYIERRYVEVVRPPRVYIEVPVYENNVYVVHDYSHDDYYLSTHSEETRWRGDANLRRATEDIEDAFRYNDITLLVNHVDPDTKIAVFAKGDYQYSMRSDEYMNITRDFMRNAQTTFFNIYRVRYRDSGVYQAYAKHTYVDLDGKKRTVYLSMVLQRIAGAWAITQIDTAPYKVSN